MGITGAGCSSMTQPCLHVHPAKMKWYQSLLLAPSYLVQSMRSDASKEDSYASMERTSNEIVTINT